LLTEDRERRVDMPIDMTGFGENERALFSGVKRLLKARVEGTEAEKLSAKQAVASCLNSYPEEKREEILLAAMWWAEGLFADEEARHHPRSH
jgi:hypothetical protein